LAWASALGTNERSAIRHDGLSVISVGVRGFWVPTMIHLPDSRVNFVRATHPTLEGTAVTRDKSSTQWNPPESWPLAAYVGEGDESRNIRPVRQALPPRARL
jgi:hypothetical protein